MKYSTREQLEKDFGEFPVGHLKHSHLVNLKFRVHQSSTAKIIISFFHAIKIRNELFDDVKNGLTKELEGLKNSWTEIAISKLQMGLCFIMLILISPILLLISLTIPSPLCGYFFFMNPA